MDISMTLQNVENQSSNLPVTFQKTLIFSGIAVTTSNPAWCVRSKAWC